MRNWNRPTGWLKYVPASLAFTVPMRNWNPGIPPGRLSNIRRAFTVPMRNWNSFSYVCTFSIASSIYRTYEELKCWEKRETRMQILEHLPYLWGIEIIYTHVYTSLYLSIYRTYEELKYWGLRLASIPAKSIYRTYEELKFDDSLPVSDGVYSIYRTYEELKSVKRQVLCRISWVAFTVPMRNWNPNEPPNDFMK